MKPLLFISCIALFFSITTSANSSTSSSIPILDCHQHALKPTIPPSIDSVDVMLPEKNSSPGGLLEAHKPVKLCGRTLVTSDGDGIRVRFYAQTPSLNKGEFFPTRDWLDWASGKQDQDWSMEFIPSAAGQYRFKMKVESRRGAQMESMTDWVEIFGAPSVHYTHQKSYFFVGETVHLAGQVCHPNGLPCYVEFEIKGPNDPDFKSIGGVMEKGHDFKVCKIFTPQDPGVYSFRLLGQDAHGRIALDTFEGSFDVVPLPLPRDDWSPRSDKIVPYPWELWEE